MITDPVLILSKFQSKQDNIKHTNSLMYLLSICVILWITFSFYKIKIIQTQLM